MKYMGSKRAMLANGLGEILEDTVPLSTRFVDLFAGSSAVARHVAERFEVPVLACDLQAYGSVLADAVLLRTKPADPMWIKDWIDATKKNLKKHPDYVPFLALNDKIKVLPVSVSAEKARLLCARSSEPIVRAYGGYYFSPLQSLILHCLRSSLPQNRATHRLGLAAIIESASVCAAAPGHTAQPFKPNDTAGKFLTAAWAKDIWEIVIRKAEALGLTYALRKGRSVVGDANKVALTLTDGDLVFVDPPYSAVHYSRFYHVFETIASASDFRVSGAGRYPPPEDRPRSEYSLINPAIK